MAAKPLSADDVRSSHVPAYPAAEASVCGAWYYHFYLYLFYGRKDKSWSDSNLYILHCSGI